jgi:hypothetical protein
VISHCSLICISLMISDFEHFFHKPVGCVYVFLLEMFIWVYGSFFRSNCLGFLLFHFFNSLYILDVNPLSVEEFAKN